MKLTTLFRSSPALWAAPVAIALPLLYYVGPGHPPSDAYGFAPEITSYPLRFAYPFAYAVTSALAAWVSGNLRQAGIWQMNHARSRYRIAAQALLPVVTLAWLMLILPPLIALAVEGVWPTWDSISPLVVGMIVCVWHAVIGFTVGRWVPKVIAAPVLAVVTWVAVAFTVTVDSPWVRHVSGAFPEQLMFGEAPAWGALWPHVAFTGSIALGLVVAWIHVRHRALTVVAALAVSVAGATGTYEAVKDYNYNPPLKTYAVTMECGHTGRTKVCMPEQTATALPQAVNATHKVLAAFDKAGVPTSPKSVIDSLPEGRFSTQSTASIWRVPLTIAAERHDAAFAVTIVATGMNCPQPDPLLRRVVIAWAAHITGTTPSWERLRKTIDRQGSPGDVDGILRSVLSRPAKEQTAWFASASRKACAG
ncbi:ABC transporter permease OS=Streptomyces alboniger OX=132473 GN=CP975_15765 PE=4 SV=1 [Streptomyces alboniger]